jgi:DNA-binding protein YbaB
MATPLPSLSSLLGPLNTLARAISDFEGGLASIVVTQQSADHKVTVVANGLGRVVSVTIDPSLVAPGDSGALASTVKTLAKAAIAAAVGQAASSAVTFATGLALPGLPAYGAPQPGFIGFGPTVDLVTQVALANNPCNLNRSFHCDSGPAHVTVDSDRNITALTLDSPLPEDVSYLGASLVDAINCAVGQSTNPPGDPNRGAPGVIGGTTLFEALVLYANGNINMGPSVLVQGLSCQGFGSIGNAGTQATEIGPQCSMGNLLSRPAVIIGPQTEVHGSLTTEDVLVADPTVIVDGQTQQNTAVVLPILQVHVQFPPTASNPINVGSGAQLTAAPAYYRSITLASRATLTVSSGVYFTDSLTIGSGSTVVVNATNGPVILWVKNALTFAGSLKDAAGAFPRIWIGYIGTAGVSLQTPFQGSIVAPNAQITLATVGAPNHVGSFHAQSLQIAPGQTICHHPFELPFPSIPGV